MKTLRVKSYAKINLTLDVLKKSGDYHKIRTVFQQIPLHDELIFEIVQTRAGAKQPPKITIISSNPRLPTKRANTIYRAIELLQKNSRTPIPPLRVFIKKNIPIAAGLGGGSSNAAATITALNRWLKLKISPARLQKIAAEIGMDVPFFLHGGTALGTHFGEKITPLPKYKLPPMLVALTAKKKSTASVYSKLDFKKTGRDTKLTNMLLRQPRSRSKLDQSLLHNDFETVASNPLIQKLKKTGTATVHLCGSGSAVYAFYSSKKQRDLAHKQLTKYICLIE